MKAKEVGNLQKINSLALALNQELISAEKLTIKKQFTFTPSEEKPVPTKVSDLAKQSTTNVSKVESFKEEESKQISVDAGEAVVRKPKRSVASKNLFGYME